MISNPQKFCLIHERKELLLLMKYVLASKARSPTPWGWDVILKDLGVKSSRVGEEIKSLPDMVDEGSIDYKWINRARYIQEDYAKPNQIEVATDSLLQPASKL